MGGDQGDAGEIADLSINPRSVWDVKRRGGKKSPAQHRKGKGKGKGKCKQGRKCKKSQKKQKGRKLTKQGRNKKMQKVERKFEKFPKNGRANLKGDSCEYIDLAKITGVDGCETGKKFVIGRASKKIRRQYLIVEEKTILAFVSSGTKFTACNSTKDITSSISCKTVINLDSFSLSSNSSSSASNSSSTAEPTTSSDSSAESTSTESPSTNNTTTETTSANSTTTSSNKTLTG